MPFWYAFLYEPTPDFTDELFALTSLVAELDAALARIDSRVSLVASSGLECM